MQLLWANQLILGPSLTLRAPFSGVQMTQEEMEHEQLILKNIQNMQEEGMEYVDRFPEPETRNHNP